VLIKKYIHSKNFLTKKDIDDYYSLVSSGNFPWFLNPKTGPGYEYEDDDAILIHTAYLNNSSNSPYYEIFLDLFNKFCFEKSITYKNILRMRINLLFSRPSNVATGPHIDLPFPHNGFLYYFNNSDGDTVFYKEKFSESYSLTNFEEDRRFSPIAGHALAFEGSRFHSPCSPKINRTRITLNIDFL
jgi:hypothetical protein